MKKFSFLVLLSLSVNTWAKQAQSYTGIDMNGKIRSCTPMKDKICTKIYSEGDQYADQCRKNGKTVIQCDCHEWICLKK